MRADVYWIAGPWPGLLGILPRPRGGEWLEDEVRSWQDAGLEMVVSLLTPHEVAELDLEREETWCRAHGIRFRSFPIPDRSVPASRAALAELTAELEQALEQGKSIAVHCRQGIGRSALVVASLLISGGRDPGSVWEHIGAARGLPVPDTGEQRDWLMQFAPALSRAIPAVARA